MSDPLITVPELHEEKGTLALFDIRWDLADPSAGRARYLEAHIPTAVFVDLDRDLAAPPGRGRHPLPSTEDFAATLGRLGVGQGTDVVVYDDAGGSVAARMWWMLRAIGHRGTVRILDGGWQAWVESGFATEPGDVVPAGGWYRDHASTYAGTIDIESVASAGHLLLDARAPERFRGDVEPIDARAGHIPGAVNTPWSQNLRSDGRLKDSATLRRRFFALGAGRRPVVVSCGSGVNACHLALALEVAGLPRPMLYPGSFSEWSASDRPVVSGLETP
ncbi:sulfurtransferase [soil metagenome]